MTRFVGDALEVWRDFPGEIASDLSQYHHRNISEWHWGEMSSAELLELAEFMDDRGRFKAALRAVSPMHPWLLKPWSAPAHAAYQTANETSILRAAKIDKENLSERIGSTLFIEPDTLMSAVEEQAMAAEARAGMPGFN